MVFLATNKSENNIGTSNQYVLEVDENNHIDNSSITEFENMGK